MIITKEMLSKDDFYGDRGHDCYRISAPIQVFKYTIEEDVSELEINISKDFSMEEALTKLNQYLKWLNSCDKELRAYFAAKTDEALPADWFDKLEVYSCFITINSAKDFGATIECGDSVFSDHILEIDFEGFKVIGDRLNG